MSRARGRPAKLPIVRRDCGTDADPAARMAAAIDLPELHKLEGETDRRFLIRKLNRLKSLNPRWATSDLHLFSMDVLKLAAQQINESAEAYAQTLAAEEWFKCGPNTPDPRPRAPR
jgi:hypothetical protein